MTPASLPPPDPQRILLDLLRLIGSDLVCGQIVVNVNDQRFESWKVISSGRVIGRKQIETERRLRVF